MDWLSLHATIPADKDMPARAARIQALTSVLEGRQYDHLAQPFSMELTPAGEYVPLDQRRPSVRAALCRTVVDDSVSLLFSEGHFPTIHTNDDPTRAALAAFVKGTRLNETMIDAAVRGSVGSVALLFRVLSCKPFVSVLNTAYLTPTYDPQDPDRLVHVREQYKVDARDLVAQGYDVDDKAGPHWFRRDWTTDSEVWYLPWPVRPKDDKPFTPQIDAERTVQHGLGFCPLVWIQNLPGGQFPDGACTFDAALDTSIELDYLLSQGGRALKYAGDPKLVITDPGGASRPLSGGAANAIVLTDTTGDAKLLEINGTAATATLDYARYLRSLALEAIHGNRADADKLSAAQSGRAMELMNQGLIWLADRLRTSYGEGALLSLARMICRASGLVSGGLLIGEERYANLNAKGLSLAWPRWYAPTADDRQQEATTLGSLVTSGLLSKLTATRILADTYDIEDVDAERLLIDAEIKAADARAVSMAATVKAVETLPA